VRVVVLWFGRLFLGIVHLWQSLSYRGAVGRLFLVGALHWGSMSKRPSREDFRSFVRDVEPRLRVALVAACGSPKGLEATAVALEYAWEHWERMTSVSNPAGYLYRLGVRRSWRLRSPAVPLLWEVPSEDQVRAEPKLAPALKHLSRQQRITVVLIDGFEWTYQEVADLLEVGRSTVQQHHQRALARLRDELGVSVDV